MVDIQLAQTRNCFSMTNHGMHGIHIAAPTMQCDSDSSAPSRGKSENKAKAVKECRVCGDGTTGTYFGAIVCLPCKTFFIRYGTSGSRRLRCRSTNSCPITVASRTRCKYCRLMKCYSVGMVRKERPEVMYAGQGQELCSVCHDIANGIHFGTYTCEGCKKFFRRGLKENHSYRCIKNGSCIVNPRSRNTCRYCRFNKCLSVGMTPKVRVGRPRKAQRESLLSAIQMMARHNSGMTSSGESDRGSSSVSVNSESEGPPSPPVSRRSDDFLPSTGSHRSDSCSSFSSCETGSSVAPPHHYLAQPVNMASPTCRSEPEMTDYGPEVFHPPRDCGNQVIVDTVAQQRPLCAEARVMVVGRSQADHILDASVTHQERQKLGKVHVGDFTYLLSESLSQRYLQVVLPYWSHPLLPSGDRVLSPEDRNYVSRLMSAHCHAVEGLQGPLPSCTILHEAMASREFTESVGEFLRLRLVRILNSFITFIKTQEVLSGVHEDDTLTIIKMCINTWALVATACRYYQPESGTLPYLHDIPMHPDNPHSPLNNRNLHMAHKLHKLNLDETETTLLAISCILATDCFEMKAPEIVEKKRWRVLEIFRAYTTEKYGWPNWRMEELFSCVPEMRLAAIWFNDLSYTTWFPPKRSSEPTDMSSL